MSEKKLINRKNKTQLIEELKSENFERQTCSFYRYIKIKNPEIMRLSLIKELGNLKVLVRIYLSTEGINAQVSVPKNLWNQFLLSINSFNEFKSMHIKNAIDEKTYSFIKLIVRIKDKLVADGLDESEYNLNKIGNYLSPKEFNKAIDDPTSIIIDVRNYYESEVGHFQNAICPDVATFKESLPLIKNTLSDKKNNKILLYCTGGIRCEKASSFLIQNGFTDVNQLEGGIIEYAHHVKKNALKSKFLGKNFVFDGRMNESITNDIISKCHQCDRPSDEHTNCNNQACHILFIQCKKCSKKFDHCCSKECQSISNLPLDEQRIIRKKLHQAAPLKQFQTSVKPKLKDLIREKNKSK